MRFILMLIGVVPAMSADSEWKSAILASNAILSDGRYEDAEKEMLRALRIAEQGANRDIEIATTLNNLGSLYQDQGRYLEAKKTYLQSIRLWEKVEGSHGVALAQPLNNLGGLYLVLGRLRDAERCLQRSLNIRRTNSGAHVPEVAAALNNLGLVHLARGQYKDAEQTFCELLDTAEAKHGSHTVANVSLLHNLGLVMAGLRQNGEAIRYFQQAVSAGEAAAGPDHPNLADSYFWLAETYVRTGNDALAAPLLLRVLQIGAKSFPAAHPLIAEAMERYADLLRRQKRKDEARTLKQQAREMRNTHRAANLLNLTVEFETLSQ